MGTSGSAGRLAQQAVGTFLPAAGGFPSGDQLLVDQLVTARARVDVVLIQVGAFLLLEEGRVSVDEGEGRHGFRDGQPPIADTLVTIVVAPWILDDGRLGGFGELETDPPERREEGAAAVGKILRREGRLMIVAVVPKDEVGRLTDGAARACCPNGNRRSCPGRRRRVGRR